MVGPRLEALVEWSVDLPALRGIEAMKALLRFQDGRSEIAQVRTSEDEAGTVYVQERLLFPDRLGGVAAFEFDGMVTVSGREVALYQEIERRRLRAVS